MIPTFHFQNSTQEESKNTEELMKLIPFGLSITSEVTRPFLLLKDESQQFTLPVAINHLEAGVTLSQANKSEAPSSPHRFTQNLLMQLGLTMERCVFTEIKGQHQYVRLDIKGNALVNEMKLRADEVMSLCLFLNVPLYASRSYIEKSKVLTAEIDQLSNSLPMKDLMIQKKDTYLM
jgi:bifunctional DNase/RNase